MSHAGRSMAGGTQAGKAAKRKADATRGRRERAWAEMFLGLSRETGRVPDPLEVADRLYALDPELLSPSVRKGAEARSATQRKR